MERWNAQAGRGARVRSEDLSARQLTHAVRLAAWKQQSAKYIEYGGRGQPGSTDANCAMPFRPPGLREEKLTCAQRHPTPCLQGRGASPVPSPGPVPSRLAAGGALLSDHPKRPLWAWAMAGRLCFRRGHSSSLQSLLSKQTCWYSIAERLCNLYSLPEQAPHLCVLPQRSKTISITRPNTHSLSHVCCLALLDGPNGGTV